MTSAELKIKYPEAVEMIEALESKDEVYYIRGNRTVHTFGDGIRYYYNYEGTHIRLFPSLEMLVKWFDGTTEENEEAENTIRNFGWNPYLSDLKFEEVWLDEDNNVAPEFCDYTNADFTEAQLAKAKRIEAGEEYERVDGGDDEDEEDDIE